MRDWLVWGTRSGNGLLTYFVAQCTMYVHVPTVNTVHTKHVVSYTTTKFPWKNIAFLPNLSASLHVPVRTYISLFVPTECSNRKWQFLILRFPRFCTEWATTKSVIGQFFLGHAVLPYMYVRTYSSMSGIWKGDSFLTFFLPLATTHARCPNLTEFYGRRRKRKKEEEGLLRRGRRRRCDKENPEKEDQQGSALLQRPTQAAAWLRVRNFFLPGLTLLTSD